MTSKYGLKYYYKQLESVRKKIMKEAEEMNDPFERLARIECRINVRILNKIRILNGEYPQWVKDALTNLNK